MEIIVLKKLDKHQIKKKAAECEKDNRKTQKRTCRALETSCQVYLIFHITTWTIVEER